MVRDDAIRRAIERMREAEIGMNENNSHEEQAADALTDALAKALANNRHLSEKLAAAEEVIKTAREWKAAALATDKRATEAEIKAKSLRADIAMLKRQRDDADKRAIAAENELRLTQQELDYTKRRAQENENARTTIATITRALYEHYATQE